MRRVWIEIKVSYNNDKPTKSPSMRRVWIEMYTVIYNFPEIRSPSMRRVWIEIHGLPVRTANTFVTLHAEGVD